MAITQGTQYDTTGKTLEQIAKEVGGKIRGDRVEYQVRGNGYKATRYLYAGQQLNTDAPYAAGNEPGFTGSPTIDQAQSREAKRAEGTFVKPIDKEPVQVDLEATVPQGTAPNLPQKEKSQDSTTTTKTKSGTKTTETPTISPEDYKMKPGESVKAYNDRIASARGETSQPQTSIDVITDPVTGRSYSRDLSVPGSTYKPYSGVVPTASSGSIAPPNQTYTDQPGEDAPKSLESIFADYGYAVSEGAKDRFKLAPAASFKEVYNNISKSLGLDKVKREMDDTLEKIGALDQELADKVADVNENPWLSEGVRVSQIRKLEERYDLKRAPYASNLTTLENLWNDGREEARYVATQSLNQYNTEREFQLDQIQEMQDMAERQFEAELKLYEAQNAAPKYAAGAIGEYQFAVQNGYTGSFTQYQNEDANRKARATGSGSGLTPYQENQTFIGLTNKYQADPIVNAGVKGQTAVAIADQVIANPQNAANQLKALYTLVKNLDPDSAVREGEVDLAQRTQSYLETFENSLARITRGQVIAPAAAVALATATKELALAWSESAARRQRQYQAQAQVGNVGGQFNQYLGAFDSGFTGGGSADDPLGIR